MMYLHYTFDRQIFKQQLTRSKIAQTFSQAASQNQELPLSGGLPILSSKFKVLGSKKKSWTMPPRVTPPSSKLALGSGTIQPIIFVLVERVNLHVRLFFRKLCSLVLSKDVSLKDVFRTKTNYPENVGFLKLMLAKLGLFLR